MTRIDPALSPLTSAGVPMSRPDACGDGEAWHREMERAQMAEWFAHGPLMLPPAEHPANVVETARAAAVTVALAPSRIAAPLSPGESTGQEQEQEQVSRQLTSPVVGLPERTYPERAASSHLPSTAAHAPIVSGVLQPTNAAASDARSEAMRIHMATAAVCAPAQSQLGPMPAPSSVLRAPASALPTASVGAAERVVQLHQALQAQLAPAVELAPMQRMPSESTDTGATARRIVSSPGMVLPAGPMVLRGDASPVPMTSPVHTVTAATFASVSASAAVVGAALEEELESPGALHPLAGPSAPASHAGDPSPVRATAHWEGDSAIYLWLGIDASALGEIASLMRRVESWLRSQGVRLLGVTCNGRRWQEPFIPIQSQEEQ
jgi:hypothetical protein